MKNLKTFYSNLEDLLLELKIASRNGEYDPKAGWKKTNSVQENHRCCQIIIDKPDRLCSVDETEVTTNMSGGSTMGRTSSERIALTGRSTA